MVCLAHAQKRPRLSSATVLKSGIKGTSSIDPENEKLLQAASEHFSEMPALSEEIPSSSSSKTRRPNAKAKPAAKPGAKSAAGREKRPVDPRCVFQKKIAKEIKSLEAVKDKLQTVTEASTVLPAIQTFCDQLASVMSDLQIFIDHDAEETEAQSNNFKTVCVFTHPMFGCVVGFNHWEARSNQ